MKPSPGLTRAASALLAIALGTAAAIAAELDLLAAGEAALEARSWTEAEMSFRRAIGEQGDSPRARIGLARALAGGGDPDAAVGELARAAERWIRTSAYGDADRLLVAASEIRPGDLAVLELLGRARVLDRRYLAAEEPLASVYAAGGASVDAHLYYSAALWENGRLERAEEVARAAVAASGGALPAVHQLGRLLLWQSRYEEAAELLERCARQAPGAAEMLIELARARDGAGDLDGALAAYRQAVELAPEHSELRYGLAMALLRSGDREAAAVELAAYERLYREDQQRVLAQGLAEARIARGLELSRQGEHVAAIEHLRQLPESADGLAALAAALRAAGDLQGAVDELGRAIVVEPGRTDLQALLNEARLELLRRP